MVQLSHQNGILTDEGTPGPGLRYWGREWGTRASSQEPCDPQVRVGLLSECSHSSLIFSFLSFVVAYNSSLDCKLHEDRMYAYLVHYDIPHQCLACCRYHKKNVCWMNEWVSEWVKEPGKSRKVWGGMWDVEPEEEETMEPWRRTPTAWTWEGRGSYECQPCLETGAVKTHTCGFVPEALSTSLEYWGHYCLSEPCTAREATMVGDLFSSWSAGPGRECLRSLHGAQTWDWPISTSHNLCWN